MAVELVTLVLDLYDGAQDLVTMGRAVLQPSVPAVDTVNHQAVVSPVTAYFSVANSTVPLQFALRACDDPDLSPAGWQWTISFPGVPGNPGGFSFFLYAANGSTQYYSAMVPVQAVAPMYAYLPLPSGTPSSGQVPVATGAGQSSAWGAGGGGGAVSSVFGRTGAVAAASADYSVGQVTGAAPLASPVFTGTPEAPTAAALDSSVKLGTTAYADAAVAVEKSRAQTAEGQAAQKPANLSDLANAGTARTNLGLGTAATQASGAFDAAGAAATAQTTAETFATSAVATETSRAETAEALALQKSANLSDLANAGTARTSLGLGSAATQATSAFDAAGAASTAQSTAETFAASAAATETSRAEAAEAGLMSLLTRVLVTAAGGGTTHTAAAWEITAVDTTSGNCAVKLPNGPAAGVLNAAKQIVLGTGFSVTVQCQGSDVINKAGGGTAQSLTLTSQGSLLHYSGTGTGVWTVISDDLPLSQLQALFAQLANNLSDLPSAASARTNLGLGSAATQPSSAFDAAGAAAAAQATAEAASLAVANNLSDVGTRQAALNNLTGTQSAGTYVRSNGTNAGLAAIQAADVPTLNQNTSGTAAGLSSTLAAGSGGTGQVTLQAALNALAGSQASGQYLRGNATNVLMSAIQAADLPAATTSLQGAVILDGTAAHIQLAGTQAAGANGLPPDSGHVHPAPYWTVADSGLLAMNFDPILAAGQQIATAGTLYLLRVNIYKAITWTSVIVGVTTAGAGTPGTGTFTGLYSSAGTLLSGSADVASSLTSTGTRTLALTTPQALAAGSFVWVALLTNMATTQPTMGRSAAANQMLNLNLGATALRAALNGTSLTALPASITPSSNTGTGAQGFWVGAA
jgi:trimeric autotransporter adhesin